MFFSGTTECLGQKHSAMDNLLNTHLKGQIANTSKQISNIFLDKYSRKQWKTVCLPN